MKTFAYTQRTAKVLCVISLTLALFSCKTQSTLTKDSNVPMSKDAFMERPFGYEPTIKNFKKHIVPPYKLQLYSVKNKHQSTETDTIYRFYRKSSELFIYKTRFGKEMFFAGNISDNKVVMFNGVQVGIPRGAFFNSFTDLKYSDNDTIKISSKVKMVNYKFVFKNEKLEAIKIDAYID
jgi:hypothetical protein